MIAGRLANLSNGTNQHRPMIEGSPIELPSVSQAEAGDLLNVGLNTVKRSKSVIDHAVPELVEMVDRDEVAVSAAATVAKLPEQQQRAIVADGPKVVQAVARDLREQRTPKPEALRTPDLTGRSTFLSDVEEEEEDDLPQQIARPKRESPSDPAELGGWWWVMKEIGKVEQSVSYYGEREWFARNATARDRIMLANNFDRVADLFKRWAEYPDGPAVVLGAGEVSRQGLVIDLTTGKWVTRGWAQQERSKWKLVSLTEEDRDVMGEVADPAAAEPIDELIALELGTTLLKKRKVRRDATYEPPDVPPPPCRQIMGLG
ncbi:hypothetical protein EP7_005595 (plasmid) [Isosphaeraceae bacterium EP7]